MNRAAAARMTLARRAWNVLQKKPLLMSPLGGRVHVPAAQRKADSEARQRAYLANRQRA